MTSDPEAPQSTQDEEQDVEKHLPNIAASAAVTAPGWAPYLGTLNAGLQTVSLILGIGFLLWQWRRKANAKEPTDDGDQ